MSPSNVVLSYTNLPRDCFHMLRKPIFIGGNRAHFKCEKCGVRITISCHPMEVTYPHTCFNCGRWILYLEALGKYYCCGKENYPSRIYMEKARSEFNEIWKNPYVKIVCCRCYIFDDENIFKDKE